MVCGVYCSRIVGYLVPMGRNGKVRVARGKRGERFDSRDCWVYFLNSRARGTRRVEGWVMYRWTRARA